VIGLASNQIEFFEDVYALTQLSTLRRVVLWGNPVERKRKDCEILVYEFGALNVQVVLESPIPPKRKVGEFYSANTTNFVRVTDKELKPIPRKGMSPLRKPHTAPAAMSEDAPPAAAGGPSFFVTQVGLEQQQQQQRDVNGGEEGNEGDEGHPLQHAQQAGGGGRRRNDDRPDETWFSEENHDADTTGAGGNAGAQGGLGAGARYTALSDGLNGDYYSAGLGPSPSSDVRLKEDPDWRGGSARDDVCRPNANVRAVMAELKRMLRQPLPPIQVPQFEQSTISTTNRKRGT
jgi:hypothetical protein